MADGREDGDVAVALLAAGAEVRSGVLLADSCGFVALAVDVAGFAAVSMSPEGGGGWRVNHDAPTTITANRDKLSAAIGTTRRVRSDGRARAASWSTVASSASARS
ncbi:MAG TPA: hypothetical protein PKA58_18175, partial [Polyangium sp.]|nr:hypothetical protein [Polyangium sp.]